MTLFFRLEQNWGRYRRFVNIFIDFCEIIGLNLSKNRKISHISITFDQIEKIRPLLLLKLLILPTGRHWKAILSTFGGRKLMFVKITSNKWLPFRRKMKIFNRDFGFVYSEGRSWPIKVFCPKLTKFFKKFGFSTGPQCTLLVFELFLQIRAIFGPIFAHFSAPLSS